MTYSGSVTPAELIATIEATGYTATLPPNSQANAGGSVDSGADNAGQSAKDTEAAAWWQRLTISAAQPAPAQLPIRLHSTSFTRRQRPPP